MSFINLDFKCLCCGAVKEELVTQEDRRKPIKCDCGGPMTPQFPAPALGLYFSNYDPRSLSPETARMEQEMEGFTE